VEELVTTPEVPRDPGKPVRPHEREARLALLAETRENIGRQLTRRLTSPGKLEHESGDPERRQQDLRILGQMRGLERLGEVRLGAGNIVTRDADERADVVGRGALIVR
jgi:hypothetical protein